MSIAALQSSQKPWVHLLILHEGETIDLSHTVPPAFVVKTVAGAKCKTKAGLLREFARALAFPDYFGHNWDALEECLADLEWLPAPGYVVVITDAEQVLVRPDEADDYETFVEILSEAGEAWSTRHPAEETGGGVPFHAILAVQAAHRRNRNNWLVPTLDITRIRPDPTRSRRVNKRHK